MQAAAKIAKNQDKPAGEANPQHWHDQADNLTAPELAQLEVAQLEMAQLEMAESV